jgi:hypothetical protein
MALQNLVITDTTPHFTGFVRASCGALPPLLTSCGVSAPVAGTTGTITWTLCGNLNAGASGTVTLTVTVNLKRTDWTRVPQKKPLSAVE